MQERRVFSPNIGVCKSDIEDLRVPLPWRDEPHDQYDEDVDGGAGGGLPGVWGPGLLLCAWIQSILPRAPDSSTGLLWTRDARVSPIPPCDVFAGGCIFINNYKHTKKWRMLRRYNVYIIYDILGDQEVTANLYCNFAYPYWEGYLICSIYLR